jgi:hypothetical protein
VRIPVTCRPRHIGRGHWRPMQRRRRLSSRQVCGLFHKQLSAACNSEGHRRGSVNTFARGKYHRHQAILGNCFPSYSRGQLLSGKMRGAHRMLFKLSGCCKSRSVAFSAKLCLATFADLDPVDHNGLSPTRTLL